MRKSHHLQQQRSLRDQWRRETWSRKGAQDGEYEVNVVIQKLKYRNLKKKRILRENNGVRKAWCQRKAVTTKEGTSCSTLQPYISIYTIPQPKEDCLTLEIFII